MAQIRLPTINAESNVTEPTDLPLQLQSATVVLTDAQIKALNSTPVQIVPAHGAGTIVIPLVAWMVSDFRAGAYTPVVPGDWLEDAQLVLRWSSTQTVVGRLSQYIDSDTITYLEYFFADTTNRNLTMFDIPARTVFGEGTEDAGTVFVMNALGVLSDPLPEGEALDLTLMAGAVEGGNAANTLKVIMLYTVVDVS